MRILRRFGVLVVACCAPFLGMAENATEGLTPQQLLWQARMMFPQEELSVTGHLGTAEKRGMNEVRRPYALHLDWSGGVPTAECKLYDTADGMGLLQHAVLTRVAGKPALTLINDEGVRTENVRLNTPIGETDLTWMDLTFDYLWWEKVRRLDEAELDRREISSRQSGRNCIVLEVEPPTPQWGLGAVRLWVDEATGNLIQIAQLDEAKEGTVRTMYAQKIGRENGRWVPREFRVARTGVSRVTKLYVGSVRSESFSTEESGDDQP